MKSKENIEEKVLFEFSNFLADVVGLYFPKERWKELEKKFILMMQAFGFVNSEGFIQWLKENNSNNKVITYIGCHFTIGETYFFRDRVAFALLKTNILPQILKHHEKDRNIRIWSVGCCTGEEAYSIAIILHQLLGTFKKWNIYILGTDINVEFLHKAEHAYYSKWSFRAMPSDIKEKYFIHSSGSTYHLIPEIKKSVTFRYMNLIEIDSAHTSFIQKMDLILCHNVLIYFSKKQTYRVINQFIDALTNHGWLSVSAIEIPFIQHEDLKMYKFPGAIFFEKEKKKEKEESYKDFIPIWPTNNQEKKIESTEKSYSEKHLELEKEKDEKIYEKCLFLSQERDYEEAISHLLSYLSPHLKNHYFLSHHLREIILLIRIYANQGDSKKALEWCELALKIDKLQPLMYYLHATILQDLGDIEHAIKSLKHTLFLDSNFVMAHYLLGLLERERKNDQLASKSFKIALELIQNYGADEILPGTDELTAERLQDLLLNKVEG